MKTDINLRDTAVLATNQLKRTGEEYALVSLSAKNIGQILALQEAGFADLTAEEQHYLLKKDREFFENHFAVGNDALGIVHKGRLIAQSVIVNPTPDRPKTGMTDMRIDASIDTVTILQGVIVDPAYRGNSLMGVMTDAWLASSEKQGRTEAISEAATDNPFSWFVFLKKGMHIESIGRDAADGTEVYNLHGHIPTLGKIFNDSAKKSVTCSLADVARQKKLIADGYKGAKFDPANGNIEFRRAKKNMRCL